MIKLRITVDGRIRGLWTDDVPFRELGFIRVRPASYVEFDNRSQCWFVREAQPRSLVLRWLQHLFRQPLGRVLHRAATRAAAFAWEAEYFQPGGLGSPRR